MPFKRQRPDLIISSEVRDTLEKVSKSRTDKASRVERAKMILLYIDGGTISAIARQLSTNRPKSDVSRRFLQPWLDEGRRSRKSRECALTTRGTLPDRLPPPHGR